MLCYLVDPIFQVINTAGKPATGGYIEVYVHGTGDKYYCASDFDGTLHPFKIPLDSLGSNIILADDANTYDIYAYNRYGSLLMSRYNVAVSKSEGGNASRKGTIHKLGLWTVDESDPSPKPNEYWILDLESPNDNEPSGYDRLTVERARDIHGAGSFFGLRTIPVQNPYEDNLLLETYYDYVSMSQTFVIQLSNISGYNEFVEYTLGGFGDYVGVNMYTTSTLLPEDGNGSNVTATFTEANTRTPISSGSKLSVLFGYIAKWLSDLKALAFKDKADLTQDVSGVLPIANGGTNASTVADARTNLDVYSKTEVESLLNGKIVIVASLPVTGDQGKIYYVGPSGSGADQYEEYLWNSTGNYFFKVGDRSLDLSGYKTKQTAVTDPSAEGSGLAFIDSVSQNANGEVALHKKSIQDGTTLQKGVVMLLDSHSSNDTAKAATPKNVKEAYDLANGKYTLPTTGIPSSDLSSGVQSSLEKANTAVQPENLASIGGESQPVYFDENGHPVEIPLVELPVGSGHWYLKIQAQGAYFAQSSGTASKLSNTQAIGNGNQPVYFDANGVPVAIPYDPTHSNYLTLAVLTAYQAESANTAASATTANSATTAEKLSASAGGESQPVYFPSSGAKAGKPVAIPLKTRTVNGQTEYYLDMQVLGAYYSYTAGSSSSANSATTAGSADKLNLSAAIGNGNQPVYFDANGVPVAIPYDPTHSNYLTLAVLTAYNSVNAGIAEAAKAAAPNSALATALANKQEASVLNYNSTTNKYGINISGSAESATNVSSSSIFSGYSDFDFSNVSLSDFKGNTSANSLIKKLPFTSDVNCTAQGLGRAYGLSQDVQNYLRCGNYSMVQWQQTRDQKTAIFLSLNGSGDCCVTRVFFSATGTISEVQYSDTSSKIDATMMGYSNLYKVPVLDDSGNVLWTGKLSDPSARAGLIYNSAENILNVTASDAVVAQTAQNLSTPVGSSLQPMYSTSTGVPAPCKTSNTVAMVPNIAAGPSVWDTSTAEIVSDYIWMESTGSGSTLNIQRLVEGKVYQFMIPLGSENQQCRLCNGNGNTFTAHWKDQIETGRTYWNLIRSGTYSGSFAAYVVRIGSNDIYVIYTY